MLRSLFRSLVSGQRHGEGEKGGADTLQTGFAALPIDLLTQILAKLLDGDAFDRASSRRRFLLTSRSLYGAAQLVESHVIALSTADSAVRLAEAIKRDPARAEDIRVLHLGQRPPPVLDRPDLALLHWRSHSSLKALDSVLTACTSLETLYLPLDVSTLWRIAQDVRFFKQKLPTTSPLRYLYFCTEAQSRLPTKLDDRPQLIRRPLLLYLCRWPDIETLDLVFDIQTESKAVVDALAPLKRLRRLRILIPCPYRGHHAKWLCEAIERAESIQVRACSRAMPDFADLVVRSQEGMKEMRIEKLCCPPCR